MGVMRTLQVDDRPTPLAQAIAEIGRIDKTNHTLNFIDNEVAEPESRPAGCMTSRSLLSW